METDSLFSSCRIHWHWSPTVLHPCKFHQPQTQKSWWILQNNRQICHASIRDQLLDIQAAQFSIELAECRSRRSQQFQEEPTGQMLKSCRLLEQFSWKFFEYNCQAWQTTRSITRQFKMSIIAWLVCLPKLCPDMMIELNWVELLTIKKLIRFLIWSAMGWQPAWTVG